MVLDRAHLLHRRWVDNGHWNGIVVCEATFPFPMLLTVCAPVKAAVDQTRIAWSILVEAEQEVVVKEVP
jgi:hypothetical protein